MDGIVEASYDTIKKKADCVNIYLWETSRCVDAYAITLRTVYGAWPSNLTQYLIDYVIAAPVSTSWPPHFEWQLDGLGESSKPISERERTRAP